MKTILIPTNSNNPGTGHLLPAYPGIVAAIQNAPDYTKAEKIKRLKSWMKRNVRALNTFTKEDC